MAAEKTSIDQVLQDRRSKYGPFIQHAEITQELKEVIRRNTPISKVNPEDPNGRHINFLAPDQQEALDMICHKIGRIVNGDPDYADSWVDIVGYAKLVANRLEGEVL